MMNPIIQFLIIAAIPLLFAITVHEAAHGFIASKFGDQTARMMGRVTLNPLKHIDPIGTILLPMLMLYLGGFIFGWAKPVPVNWENLNNPKRDAAFVAVAGPLSNFIMALMWAMIGKLILVLNHNQIANELVFSNPATLFYNAAKFGVMINLGLMLINLIPIPPLDGSRIVASLLPSKASRYYNSIEPYGIWILLALLVFGLLQWILMPLLQILMAIIFNLFGLIS